MSEPVATAAHPASASQPTTALRWSSDAAMQGREGRECTTVIVGEFTDLLHRGLLDLFRDDSLIEVVAGDLAPTELVAAATANRARVAVVHASTPQGLELALEVKAAQPSIATVMVAHEPSVSYGKVALAIEASCLASSATDTDVLTTTSAAARGGRTFVDGSGRRTSRGPLEASAKLTQRECEVIALLCRGESQAAIGLRLGVSPETIHTQVTRIRTKVGVSGGERLWRTVFPRGH